MQLMYHLLKNHLFLSKPVELYDILFHNKIINLHHSIFVCRTFNLFYTGNHAIMSNIPNMSTIVFGLLIRSLRTKNNAMITRRFFPNISNLKNIKQLRWNFCKKCISTAQIVSHVKTGCTYIVIFLFILIFVLTGN